MEVPAAKSIRDIYPESSIASQTRRWQTLLSRFEAVYGTPATYVSRSPGRVNLIGEHIDYNLYDVLPMAVTADVLVAFAPSPDPLEFRLENANTARFEGKKFRVTPEGEVDIDASTLDWANYFKAGLRGAARLLRENHGVACPAGMLVLVDGNVPPGGGLSSSSAFVCASALAAIVANGVSKVDKRALVELAIVSERAVGVNGGGMDQSASVFSERGSATLVSFVPALSAMPVPFPDVDPPLSFVVANSFVAADKHVTAPVCYNLRVVECTLAGAVLAKVFGVASSMPKRDSSPLGTSLRGFHDAYFLTRDRNSHGPNGTTPNGTTSTNGDDGAAPTASKQQPNEMMVRQLEILLDLVDDYLPQEEGYTAEQIAHLLDTTADDLHDAYMCRFPVRASHFKLRQRATHVFSEALRVLRFHRTLLAAAERGRSADVPRLLAELGALMNETQDSCRDVYECSCPELDDLCRLARGAGAVGSRLTGAGWGGGSVHLVPKDKVDDVRRAWEEGYYRKRWPDITEERLKDAIVVSEPSSGSYIFTVAGSSVT